VDWGGTGIVTSNRNFRDGDPSNVAGTVADRDVYYNYQDQSGTALSPTGGGYAAQPFYGGIFGEEYVDTGGFDDRKISNDDTNGDYFNLRFQTTGSSGQSGRVHMAVFFDKGDFLAGADASPVSFDSASSLSFAPDIARLENLGEVHWLVRNATQFYVSQTLVADSADGRLLDGTELAAEMWAAYDPTAAFNMDFDQASASFTTATSAFTDITAVGFMVDKDTFTASRHWLQFRDFEVDAVPEPGCAALLVAGGLVVLVCRRHRRG
jgi:hypothetical protein